MEREPIFEPSATTLASLCYSKHSDLFVNNSTVNSQSGMQKGDPLSSLLFSQAIWPPIDKIKSNHQTSRDIAGISMTDILQVTRSNFAKCCNFSDSGEKFS